MGIEKRKKREREREEEEGGQMPNSMETQEMSVDSMLNY